MAADYKCSQSRSEVLHKNTEILLLRHCLEAGSRPRCCGQRGRDATRLAGRVTFAAPSVRTRDDFRLTKIGRLHSIPNKVGKNSGPKGPETNPGRAGPQSFPVPTMASLTFDWVGLIKAGPELEVCQTIRRDTLLPVVAALARAYESESRLSVGV